MLILGGLEVFLFLALILKTVFLRKVKIMCIQYFENGSFYGSYGNIYSYFSINISNEAILKKIHLCDYYILLRYESVKLGYPINLYNGHTLLFFPPINSSLVFR